MLGIRSFGFRDSGFGFRVSGFGFRVSCLPTAACPSRSPWGAVKGLGFRVLDCGFPVS